MRKRLHMRWEGRGHELREEALWGEAYALGCDMKRCLERERASSFTPEIVVPSLLALSASSGYTREEKLSLLGCLTQNYLFTTYSLFFLIWSHEMKET